jgi:hypothetical protein
MSNLREMIDIKQVWGQFSDGSAILHNVLEYINKKIERVMGGMSGRGDAVGQNLCRWSESGQLRSLQQVHK